jgi:hypothetical protein
MKVMALCASLIKAADLIDAAAGLDGVEPGALVARERSQGRLRTAVKWVYEALRMGPSRCFRLARMLHAGRLVLSIRPLDDTRVCATVAARGEDVGLHAAGVIYRRPLIEAFRLGILNPHIGLLPVYRGRSVMEWSLLHGDPTGVTTFFIDEGIDTGPRLVLRKEVPVWGELTIAAAKNKLFALDGEMFREAVERLLVDETPEVLQTAEDGRRFYVMSHLLASVVESMLVDRAHDPPDRMADHPPERRGPA